MVRPNPRYGDPSSSVVVDELARLQRNLENAEKLADRAWGSNPYGSKGGASNPSLVPLPSWWDSQVFERAEDTYTKEQAIEYLKVSEKIIEARRAIMSYRCDVLGSVRDCQNLGVEGVGVLSRIRRNIKWLEAQIIGLCPGNNTPDSFKLCPKEPEAFQLLPEVYAEEDPSVNSGLNGNEQESQVINYPQSANVRITFTSNIGMFSTSIPINDIGQLQVLSSASNEWKYTLIGHGSTNPPLMTLHDLINRINNQIASVVTSQPPIEEEPVGPEVPGETTADIPPPTTEEPEVPVVTVPTEKFVVSKPGRLTMSDMTNTNAWVGILIAGTLAVPVFSSILSKRK